MQTVLVIDDHLIVRQGLRNLIENVSNNSITVEECSGLDDCGVKKIEKQGESYFWDLCPLQKSLKTGK